MGSVGRSFGKTVGLIPKSRGPQAGPDPRPGQRRQIQTFLEGTGGPVSEFSRREFQERFDILQGVSEAEPGFNTGTLSSLVGDIESARLGEGIFGRRQRTESAFRAARTGGLFSRARVGGGSSAQRTASIIGRA